MLKNKLLSAMGGAPANYIEEVFSTWLYTGTGATQTITNGIDLAGKGGLAWIKSRSAATDHFLFDTVRGALNEVNSNSTAAQVSLAASLTAFNANGFSLGSAAGVNTSSATYASWTFRDQAKFFDVVTYTGTGANRTIAHNLGSVPGCILVKRTDNTGDWQVYHRSLANTQYMVLNDTAAVATGATRWNSTTPTDSVFSLGTDATVNASGGTYVAYLFAHDAGGFGLTGTDNVVSCGSFTTDGSGNAAITLGYEPQWVLIKQTDDTGSWFMFDSMRGWTMSTDARLFANNASVEDSSTNFGNPTATGFTTSTLSASGTFIYIAIRRGPMKVPTDGTSVFAPVASDNAQNTQLTTNFPIDSQWFGKRSGGYGTFVVDRLRGNSSVPNDTAIPTNPYLWPWSTSAESTSSFLVSTNWNNTGFGIPGETAGTPSIYWNFRRAPGFFDGVSFEVAGIISDSAEPHNLGVVPELMIFKPRAQVKEWVVWHKDFGTSSWILLNSSNAAVNSGPGTMPVNTATTFGVNSTGFGFTSFLQCMAYLFATCPGVSKVGSYTGNGSNQTINCGFTGGARFVMIKRTDSTGDWYVWDTARGIVSGNDPRLSLNTTAAEVTTDDSVDTDSTGFVVNQLSATNINVTSATYIYLAIA